MLRPITLGTALLALAACSESHGNDDAGRGLDGTVARDARVATDAPAGDCPPIGAPRCVDDRCCREEAPAVLDPDCSYHCPAGYTVDAICDPEAECFDFASPCAANADCTLAITDCCGPCGRPGLTDYEPILASRSDEHFTSVCPDPDGAICPGCPVMPNPNLGAVCEAGVCTGYDVRALELSACSEDTDCRIRTRDCCECGGATDPSSLIAVRVDSAGDYGALVCDDAGCPECAPVYPDTHEAYCADDGHCDVRPVP